jgi:hypothetical protein
LFILFDKKAEIIPQCSRNIGKDLVSFRSRES